MKRKKLVFFITLFVVIALSIISGHKIADKAVAQSAGKPKLVMVTSADYPPYEFRDTATGNEIIGFDVDIAKYITKELGRELEITDTDFNGIIPALQSRRADFAMAGMTPTAERRKNVDFSNIYYEAKNTIVAPKGSNLKSPEALAGKTIGVQLGSTQEKAAQEFKNVKLRSLNRTAEIIQEVKSKRIAAAIIEDTIARGFIDNNPDLEFNTVANVGEAGSAIAFPKGSDLVDDFNGVLAQMQQNGEIERLVKKWFENNGKETAATATTSDSGFGFSRIAPSIPYIIDGIGVTLLFTALSAFFGFIWGVILSLFKISTIKPLQWFGTAYTSVF